MEYFDEKGNKIYIDDIGNVFVNDSLVEEVGSDADFDSYSVEVQNGSGYYNSSGRFVFYENY